MTDGLFRSKKSLLVMCLIMGGITATAQTQTFAWVKGMGGSDNEQGNRVAVDGAGNVYVTGFFKGTADFDPGTGTANLTSAGNQDIFLAKYDAAGNYVWAKSMGGLYDDQGLDIAVDGSGKVYVTGIFKGTADFDPGTGTANLSSVATSNDVFVSKYDTAGNYVWAKSVGGNGDDQGLGIAVDGSGNVHVTGYFSSATADFDPGTGVSNLSRVGTADIFVAKYDINGNYTWARNIGSSGNDNWGQAIGVDGSGNVYVTGYFFATVDFDPGTGTANLTSGGGCDVFLAKYDAGGNYVWAKQMGGSPSDYDAGYGLAVDGSGNAYVTGIFTGTMDADPGSGTANLTSGGNYDVFFAKYDAGGNYVYAKKVGGSNYDQSLDITADGSGNVYVTGYFTSATADFDPGTGTANLTNNAGGYDGFVAKYDAGGNYVWAEALSGPGNDQGMGVAADGFGNVYVTGTFSATTSDFDPGAGTATLTSAGVQDIFLVKYSRCKVYGSLTASRCDSFTFNGATYKTSGTYTNTLIAAASSGCDSVVTLTLTINHPVRTNEDIAICHNQLPYHWNGQTINTGGNAVATATFTSAANCDSVVTLNLTISHTDTIRVTSCDSFSLDGQTHTATGLYTYTYTSTPGCDSILVLDLTINHSPEAIITQTGNQLTASAGNSYQWIDCAQGNTAIPNATSQSYTAPAGGGSYAVVVTSANSCSDTSDCIIVFPAGISDIWGDRQQISLYPNPATGIVTLSAARTFEHATLRLVNLVGMVVWERPLSGRQEVFDVSRYAPGIYMVEVAESQKETVRIKLIKE